jgi:hypothetical protein
LEVTIKDDKYRENDINSTTFCFPHVDEDEACDMNLNWSCPCRDGFSCTEGKPKKGKPKDYSKYYRPTVTWKKDEECPTLYKKKTKNDKYIPTCQEDRRRSGRSTAYEEVEKETRPLVFVSQ